MRPLRTVSPHLRRSRVVFRRLITSAASCNPSTIPWFCVPSSLLGPTNGSACLIFWRFSNQSQCTVKVYEWVKSVHTTHGFIVSIKVPVSLNTQHSVQEICQFIGQRILVSMTHLCLHVWVVHRGLHGWWLFRVYVHLPQAYIWLIHGD